MRSTSIRNTLAALSVFALFLVAVVPQAEAARRTRRATFSSVCKTVRTLPSTIVYKTVGSDHFSNGDPRKPYPNVIGKFGAPSLSAGNDIVDNKGNVLAKMGFYGRWVGGSWRNYQTVGYGAGSRVNASGLAAAARRNTGSTNVYIRGISGSVKGTCYGPITPTRCYNSIGC